MSVGYSVADCGNSMESRKSITGYLLLVNGSPVAWKSKLQQPVGLLTVKSEWTTMVSDIRHGLFLEGIWFEPGFPEGRMHWVRDKRGATQGTSTIDSRERKRRVYIKLKCTRK